MCRQKSTPPFTTPIQGDPERHILHSPTEDLQDLQWSVHALEEPLTTPSPAPSSGLNTPMFSHTPSQEWITLDSIGEIDISPPPAV